MSNILNFTNHTMREYASLYNTVEGVLGHLLFVIGNGFGFDSETGMLIDYEKHCAIDKYPELTQRQRTAFAKKCIKKYTDRGYTDRANEFQDMCNNINAAYVDESAFTEYALYNNIIYSDQQMKQGNRPGFYRPYPLCEYSMVYSLNKNTPVWMVQIAINLCNAWIRYLNQSLETGNYWAEGTMTSADKAMSAYCAKMGITYTMPSEPHFAGHDSTEEIRNILVDTVARLYKLVQ